MRAAFIIAAAQPTSLSTLIAPAEQFIAQAPHSMHSDGATRRALPLSALNTPWGQTEAQMPQLLQSSGSYSSVFYLQ